VGIFGDNDLKWLIIGQKLLWAIIFTSMLSLAINGIKAKDLI
jgi:hypothetical protein